MPARRGDEAPHPVEWYILKTQQRQQRARAWEFHRQEAEKGLYDMVPVKTSRVNGIAYNVIQRGMENELILYFDTKPVMTLYRDGHEREPPSTVTSGRTTPVRKFTLGPPPAEAVTGLTTFSRLRANYREFLKALSDEALETELLEWEEELTRATEHMEAVEEELARRGR